MDAMDRMDTMAISLVNVTKLQRDVDYPLFREEIELAAREFEIWDYIDEDGIQDVEDLNPGEFPEAPPEPIVPQHPGNIPPLPILAEFTEEMDEAAIIAVKQTNEVLMATWQEKRTQIRERLDDWKAEMDALTTGYTLNYQIFNTKLVIYDYKREKYDQTKRDLMAFNTQMAALIGPTYSEVLKQALRPRGRLIRLRDRINQDEQQRSLNEKLQMYIRCHLD